MNNCRIFFVTTSPFKRVITVSGKNESFQNREDLQTMKQTTLDSVPLKKVSEYDREIT